ncbi:MAG TPA: hypothetical protein VGI68_13600 [Mycobacterium sp.]
MVRATPDESRGGPINYSDADWGDLVPLARPVRSQYAAELVAAVGHQQSQRCDLAFPRTANTANGNSRPRKESGIDAKPKQVEQGVTRAGDDAARSNDKERRP